MSHFRLPCQYVLTCLAHTPTLNFIAPARIIHIVQGKSSKSMGKSSMGSMGMGMGMGGGMGGGMGMSKGMSKGKKSKSSGYNYYYQAPPTTPPPTYYNYGYGLTSGASVATSSTSSFTVIAGIAVLVAGVAAVVARKYHRSGGYEIEVIAPTQLIVVLIRVLLILRH